MIGIGGVCGSFKSFGRPFIGTVAAFAVAAQTLLIAFGLAIPARADLGTPTFELCLHDARDAPEAPAGDPGIAVCAHCIFCFAGSHQAALAAPPVLLQRVDFAIALTFSAAGRPPLPGRLPHSIASPRGPPFGA
jgi:hypothetical protein